MCKLFFRLSLRRRDKRKPSKGYIRHSRTQTRVAPPNRVNIPLTPKRVGNAPEARFRRTRSRKGTAWKKKDLRSRRIYSRGPNCIASASQLRHRTSKPGSIKPGLVAWWRPLGSANTPRGKTNRLERGDTFAETGKIFYICIEIGKHCEHTIRDIPGVNARYAYVRYGPDKQPDRL